MGPPLVPLPNARLGHASKRMKRLLCVNTTARTSRPGVCLILTTTRRHRRHRPIEQMEQPKQEKSRAPRHHHSARSKTPHGETRPSASGHFPHLTRVFPFNLPESESGFLVKDPPLLGCHATDSLPLPSSGKDLQVPQGLEQEEPWTFCPGVKLGLRFLR